MRLATILVLMVSTVSATGQSDEARFVPVQDGSVREAMFKDFFVYQTACDGNFFSGDGIDEACNVRDYVGFYLNAFGWCANVSTFFDTGWEQCNDRTNRFARPVFEN